MCTDENSEALINLVGELEEQMLKLYGAPIITGDELKNALGYKSIMAFRQAMTRDTVPVPIFTIQNRRGKFALVKDVARWLAEQRFNQSKNKE